MRMKDYFCKCNFYKIGKNEEIIFGIKVRFCIFGT